MLAERLYCDGCLSWSHRAEDSTLASVFSGTDSCLNVPVIVKFLVPEPVPGYSMSRGVSCEKLKNAVSIAETGFLSLRMLIEQALAYALKCVQR